MQHFIVHPHLWIRYNIAMQFHSRASTVAMHFGSVAPLLNMQLKASSSRTRGAIITVGHCRTLWARNFEFCPPFLIFIRISEVAVSTSIKFYWIGGSKMLITLSRFSIALGSHADSGRIRRAFRLQRVFYISDLTLVCSD